MNRIGVGAIHLVLPATAVDRSALAAARGVRGKGLRRVAGADEDALTLAYDAAVESPKGFLVWGRGGIADGVARDAALLSRALGRDRDVTVISSGLRSGWDLWSALSRSGAAPNGVLVLSDVRSVSWSDTAAQSWSDGAAALTWTAEDPCLELVEAWAHESWHPDARHAPDTGQLETDDSAFALDRGIGEGLSAMRRLVRIPTGAKIHWALSLSAAVAARRVERLFAGESVITTNFSERGFVGVADPAFVLVEAASRANIGDYIALGIFGYGYDVLLFRITRPMDTVVCGPRWRAPLRTVPPDLWRDFRRQGGVSQGGPGASLVTVRADEAWAIDAEAGQCTCGARTFPLAPRCHSCGRGDLQRVPLARTGQVFTFTVDYLHGAIDPPTTMIVADMDNGGRVYLQGCDDLHHEVRIGTRVERVLRRLHDGEDGRTPHYFWKLRGAG